MAKEAQQTGRAFGQPKARDTTPQAKTDAGEADKKTASAGDAPDDLAGYQSSQFEALRAVLDKRSEKDTAPSEVAEEFASLWLPSLAVDFELLVPAVRQAEMDQTKTSAAAVQKDLINILLANLIREQNSEGMTKAILEALSSVFSKYERAAQKERQGLGENEGDLGRKMKERFERLKRQFVDLDHPLGEAMDLLAPRSLSLFPTTRRASRESDMARYSSNSPERDDQGRFVSDDDRRSSRNEGRGRGGPGRDEDGRFASVDHRGSSRGEGRGRDGPDRDEDGRFVSEGRGSRSRYDDDDNGSRGRSSRRNDDYESDRRSASRSRNYDERDDGRRQSGWFGDSEGHAEASRRGWQRSDHGESGWLGDREGHSEASRRGWRSPDHGDSGWFGDREGHSEASRRGWQRSDHGDSGWYGDSEGHSEAARRGWEEGHRSQRRDDDDDRQNRSSRRDNEYRSRSRHDEDRRYESRRRSDDDDDRRSGGRGHGGWSGDPEGHSEASRRGWENRR